MAIGCAGAPQPRSKSSDATSHSTPYGRMKRSQIESDPSWAGDRADAHADADAARALLTVPPGATVRVFYGAWCSDSRRELLRFFKALDLAGGAPPFAIEYISVDRSKSAPGGLTDGANLKYVPTFVVLREGKEIGRIVESAPSGIERDLGALLRGEQTGVISGRHDM
jgi:hypothetical protein